MVGIIILFFAYVAIFIAANMAKNEKTENYLLFVSTFILGCILWLAILTIIGHKNSALEVTAFSLTSILPVGIINVNILNRIIG